MSSQQMMHRTQNASCSKSWKKMFPNPQLNEQSSNTFLKKLVAIAISNITYLRNVFPEGAYADRYLEGLNLKVLRDEGCYPAVSQLIKWIKGSFEALDYKYLRQLIIGIYENASKPNDVLETYSFHFSYTNKTLTGCSYYQDDGKNKRELSTDKSVTPEETFEQTINLFRHCLMCTQSLKPLPLGAMINMRLLYYDNVTPEEYEPPGFKPSPVSSYTFVNDPILLNLGKTDTPWHSMKLLIATDASVFEIANDHSSNPIDYITPENSQIENRKSPVNMEISVDVPPLETPVKSNVMMTGSQQSQNAVVPTISPDEPGSAISTTGSRSSIVEGNELQLQNRVRCPCGFNEEDGFMIFCEKCKFWQHAVCFKIILEDDISKDHYCELCHDSTNNCTDPSLPHLMPNQRKEICLYRRALVFCSNNYRLCGNDLAESLGTDLVTAQTIITKLDKDGVLKLTTKNSKGKFRLINKYSLKKSIIPNYFPSNPTSKGSPKTTPKTTPRSVSFKDQQECGSKMAISDSIEKMTISGDDGVQNTPKSSKGDKSAQKRNLSQEIEDVIEIDTDREENMGPSKKKRKISVTENFNL